MLDRDVIKKLDSGKAQKQSYVEGASFSLNL